MKINNTFVIIFATWVFLLVTWCSPSNAENETKFDVIKTNLGPLKPISLPTNQIITPELAPNSIVSALNPQLTAYPKFTVGQAISEALSPDGNTLAVLTTGFNKYRDSTTGKADLNLQNEYIFLYDISSGNAKQIQVLQIKNTWAGITFSPDGKNLYVSGGIDDLVHSYQLSNGKWKEALPTINLNHKLAVAPGNLVKPIATGIASTIDGKILVVANMFNDSISILDTSNKIVLNEVDLRPGKNGGLPGTEGGTYPFWVAIKGNTTAYISSIRDREIVIVDIPTAQVTGRISLSGNPNKMILNRAQNLLLVALDNADSVAIINTNTNAVLNTVGTIAPTNATLLPKSYKGAAPNSLALSTDEHSLYVTNNGTNSIAVIAMDKNPQTVIGLIPTTWSPQHVIYGPNGGGMLYVVNSKSLPGPNTGNCLGYQKTPCLVKSTPVKQSYNQYILQLSKASLQSLPAPKDISILNKLTTQVIENNHFGYRLSKNDEQVMSFLHNKIKHVIYIIRENRTYDQVLGDLGKGNGDKSLTEFPAAITPNQHALANQFIILDNFFDPGEVSGNGWPWSVSARESDFGVKMLPPNYAGRGGTYDWEGQNRNVFVGAPVSQRQIYTPSLPNDPDILAGFNNVAAPDGPNGEKQKGYLWSSALRAGLKIRNYGFFTGNVSPDGAAGNRTPFASKVVQVAVSDPELQDHTDLYFRAFDSAYPEVYRQAEWEREFKQFVANGDLPALSLVNFGGDHTGAFDKALDGVDTPETQVAANDYAIGKLVEAVAKSPYADSTLIFMVEDDCQDGPDHVDEHRSISFVVGPYVKQGGVVISTKYSTINILRTIEDILGIDYLSINDSNQAPMTDIFDLTQSQWTFKSLVPDILHSTKLALPEAAPKIVMKPKHNGKYWASVTKGMDFSKEDQVDASLYNRILWKGIMGTQYPNLSSKK